MNDKRISIAAVALAALLGCADSAPRAGSEHDRIALGALPESTRDHVKRADYNHDGFLSTHELARFYAKRTRELFHRIDRTGLGGGITVEEFVGYHNARLIEQLRYADKNGDGALTRDEVGPLRWVRLQVADTDHDGKVTFSELERAFQRRPKLAPPALETKR
jgi:hypothetical protein